MKKYKWFISLGVATFIGKRKVSERIIKKRLSRVDLEIFDIGKIVGKDEQI